MVRSAAIRGRGLWGVKGLRAYGRGGVKDFGIYSIKGLQRVVFSSSSDCDRTVKFCCLLLQGLRLELGPGPFEHTQVCNFACAFGFGSS